MAKNKRKSKSAATAGKEGGASTSSGVEEEEQKQKQKQKQQPMQQQHDDSDDSSASSSDDDSLVLEGAVIRNPDASDSEDDDDDDEISSEEEEEEPTKKKAKKATSAAATSKKQKSSQQQQPKKKKKKQQSTNNNEPETIQVEFLFCDTAERFFHGMKTLLHRHSIHAPHSSQLADLIIENEMVGTVLSSDIDPTAAAAAKKPSSKKSSASALPPPPEEDNVFGFASIINVTTNHASPAIQSLKALCLKHCPQQHRSEMETVLSGKTKRPAGFFFQERMVNVPLEITEVLHQQLVLDMDYAVDNADDEEERKSLDFGAFVRLAPCYKSTDGGGASNIIYKYFDDEIFATNAEFVYNFEAPKMYEGDEADLWCSVIVMTKTGHRGAMKELNKMIHGS